MINFAHAAIGMYLANAFYIFRETGDLLLPVVGLPERVHLIDRPTVSTAFLVILPYAALLGLVLYLLVFRSQRNAPALSRVVASIGLFLYFWAMVDLRVDAPPATRRYLPAGTVSLFGRPVFVDRLWIAAIAIGITVVLYLVYRHTRFGLATTAAAESPRGAALAGIDATRFAAVNWMVSTALAAFSLIIVGPINGLDPLNTSLLVVPALAAALVGGFNSFIWVAVAGFGIGMAQSELVNLQADAGGLGGLGLQQGLPFLVILLALWLGGQRLPSRGEAAASRLPASPRPRHVPLWTGVLVAGGVLVMSVGSSDWRLAIITSCIAAIISLSVVVLTGYIGQISFAPYAFAGVAAFSLTKLGAAGVGFPFAPIIAVAVTTLLGVAVGVPAVRVRGMALAITTLGAAVAIEQLLFKWRWFTEDGGDVGEPSIGPLDLGISALGDDYPRRAFGYFCIATLAVAGVLVANLRRGRTGAAWLAVRSNERAAAGAGIDVTAAKLQAFAISSALAGVGGILLAYELGTISVNSFGVFASIAALAITYLAGIASVRGALVAGLIAPLGILTVLLQQDTSQVSEYSFVVNGALLVVAAVAAPEGIVGSIDRLSRRVGTRPAAQPAR